MEPQKYSDSHVEFNRKETETFLGTLFDEHDLIELRLVLEGGDPRPKTWFFQAGDITQENFAEIKRLNQHERAHVYFGICPRPERSSPRREDIQTARCLWADLDHCSPEDAQGRVQTAGLPHPSITVNSGHGVHLYWLLQDPVQGPDELRRLEELQAAVYPSIRGDHVQDVSRLMRLPGFDNHKDDPTPCQLIECRPDRRYPLDEFIRFRGQLSSQTNGQEQQVGQPALPKDLPASLKRVLERLEQRRGSGGDWTACCPAHEDRNPSLSVTWKSENGQVLLHCFAGCEYGEILNALNLTKTDLAEPVGRREREAQGGLMGKIEEFFNDDDRDDQGSEANEGNGEPNWQEQADRFQEQLSDEERQKLAAELAVTPEALRQLEVGWCSETGCYTFPEKDAQGKVIGIQNRFPDGRKRNRRGGKRGLYLPVDQTGGIGNVLLLPEGSSDTAACLSLGFRAVGRPSAQAGIELLEQLLAGYEGEILVVADNDINDDENCPGHAGALKTARKLAERLERNISWTKPPDEFKDMREWLADADVDLNDSEALQQKGIQFLISLKRDAKETPPDWKQEEELQQAEATLGKIVEQAQSDKRGAIQSCYEKIDALAVAASDQLSRLEHFLLKLNQAGVSQRQCERIRSAVKDKMKKQRAAEKKARQQEARLLKTQLPEAPVPDGVLVPAGWKVSAAGLRKLDSKDGKEAPVTSVPIFIDARYKDRGEGTESLRLCWYRDGAWKQELTERSQVANSREIVKLAGVGFPVTSNNARFLIQYLADFEAVNLEQIPCYTVSRRLGWQGKTGFLCGKTLLRPMTGKDTQAASVFFHGRHDGEEQLADAIQSSGSFDKWKSAIEQLKTYPQVIVALYGSLAPPLLQILEAPNFIMDWSYATSTGKTTLLRLAASCWGCPDETQPYAVLGTWDSTRVFIERASAVLSGLPLILDDTKRARREQDVAQTFYDVANGRGRGRGSIEGLRRSESWRTVLLSSGEAPATSFTHDGGTVARVLTIWGPPFGKADETTAPLVHKLDLTAKHHFGHAGPRFVQFLLDHRDQWPAWKKRFEELQQRYADFDPTNSVAHRLARYFAVLESAARLANEALGLNCDVQEIFEQLWKQVVAEVNDSDRAAQALRYVAEWVSAHEQDFYVSGKGRQPPKGWAGVWGSTKPSKSPSGRSSRKTDSEWDYVGFLKYRLTELLKEAGFDPEGIIRTWHDRGWLKREADSDGRERDPQARIGDQRRRVKALKREAFERVLNVDLAS